MFQSGRCNGQTLDVSTSHGMYLISIKSYSLHLHNSKPSFQRRDQGWIRTLLEEAENERLHLMTFMTLRRPSIWFRAMVLGAQGVFFNTFFLSYLISPRLVFFLQSCSRLSDLTLIDNLEPAIVSWDFWKRRLSLPSKSFHVYWP